jgi:hypothetical protein
MRQTDPIIISGQIVPLQAAGDGSRPVRAMAREASACPIVIFLCLLVCTIEELSFMQAPPSRRAQSKSALSQEGKRPQHGKMGESIEEAGTLWQGVFSLRQSIPYDDMIQAAVVSRTCMICTTSTVVQGVAADHQDGKWIAFFCKNCAPHLSVRNNAQVPVEWPDTSGSTNATGRFSMLPLYKRCRKCRRFATFGPQSDKRKELHCKIHKEEGEVDVVHKKLCEHFEGCTMRPSFSLPGDRFPRFCLLHKQAEHVDVAHVPRCRWRGGEGNKLRCPRVPLYGSKVLCSVSEYILLYDMRVVLICFLPVETGPQLSFLVCGA